MAFSAHENPEDIIEYECDEATLDSQAAELASWIREAKYFVVFTGAGISTSAGIPDYRGPQGVWTLQAQGDTSQNQHTTFSKFLAAVPTRSHMALVEMEKVGLLKFLISQNCDGLHRRSGFPPEKLAELHGNSNLDRCQKCGKEYLIDFHTRNHTNQLHDHRTGRRCLICGHELFDTIIQFGEELPEKAIDDGFINSQKADLHLVLGSSLTVSPACLMPRETVMKGGKLVIVNLQKTPLDQLADLRIYAKVDTLMEKVMKHLNLEIPEWVLKRWILISLKNGNILKIEGLEPDGTPASILSKVQLLNTNESSQNEPFEFNLKNPETKNFKLKFYFMGNYNEKPKEIEINFDGGKITERRLRFELHLGKSDWEVIQEI